MAQDSANGVFVFTWRIENFSMCPQKRGECIQSPDFVVDVLDGTTWYLVLYPKGHTPARGIWASCFLYRENKSVEPDKVSVCYDIKHVSRNTKSYRVCTNKHTFKRSTGHGYVKFMILKNLSDNKDEFLPNDVLTLLCAMRRGPDASKKETEGIDISASLVNDACSTEEISTVVSEADNSEKLRLDNCVVSTRIPVERSQITWIIRDFKKQIQTAKKIPLSVESRLLQKSRLLVHFYSNGDWGGDGSVAIDIQRKDRGLKQMLLKCKMSVLDKNGIAQESVEDQYLFGEDYEVWSFVSAAKLNILENRESELLNDGALTLWCEFFTSYKEEAAICENSHLTKHSTDPDTLQVGLIKMFNKGELTDVTLVTKELRCLVHKSVICAQSPVFKAMFTNDTEEKRTGEVHITDIESNTLRYLIQFMYENSFNQNLQHTDVMKLYSAADKYEVLTLKKECSTSLKYTLSVSNVCDVLLLSDLHQDADLLKHVHDFMRVHSDDVFQSKEWNALMKHNIQLAGETMRKILVKKQKRYSK